jgi:nitrate reductase alpha subunit
VTDLESPIQKALIGGRRFFTKVQVSEDDRAVFKKGGREGDSFYRDRWAHDKVVRSTHGVNCTGSCSWKVYVKDGIITWEAQQTDYPSAGADRPEYEPSRLPARCGVQLVHLLADPGALSVRPRGAAGHVSRGQAALR